MEGKCEKGMKQDSRTRSGKPGSTRSGPRNHSDFKGYNNSYTRYPASRATTGEKAASKPEEKSEESRETGAVIGRNAVRELLRSGLPVDKIFVSRGEREGSITMLVSMALEQKIPVIEVDRRKLDLLSGSIPHQGIVAMAAQKEYCSVEDILEISRTRGEPPLIVIADNINDPNNLGALIRCAEGAGAHGVIIPKRHSTGISPAVIRASAGASEHMAIAKVTNIAQTLEELKKLGIWTYAAEADGTPYDQTDFAGPCALVFGSEGEGISQNVRSHCDFTVSIPMYGKMNSLNVSAAAAIITYSAKQAQVRQRASGPADPIK